MEADLTAANWTIPSGHTQTTTSVSSEAYLTRGADGSASPDAAGPTVNATVDPTDAASGYFYQVEQLTFLWVLFTLIVIGNATVLIALTLAKGRKSRMNFFIKNLAAADLFVGLISVLTDIIWKITISWEAGLVACKLIRFLQAVVTYASTYVLVALSIDRYDAITHPMNFTGSWRRAKGLVVIAWVLSFLFSSPILHFYETTETENYGTQCWIDFDAKWKWQLYMTLVSVTLFVIPAFLIGGCYIIIVITIWSKGNEMVPGGGGAHTSSVNGGSSTQGRGGDSSGAGQSSEVLIKKKGKKRKGDKSDKGSTTEDVESRRASSRGLIPKAKVKTVKMTFVIIFVFILCWSPYILFDLLQVYDIIPVNNTTTAVATFIQSLAPLNSAANPLIYCLFSTNAGQNFCNFLGCCGKRRRTDGSSAQQRGHSAAQNTKSTTLHFNSSSEMSSRTSRATSSSTGVSTSRGPHQGIMKNHSVVSSSSVSWANGSGGARNGSRAARESLVINNF